MREDLKMISNPPSDVQGYVHERRTQVVLFAVTLAVCGGFAVRILRLATWHGLVIAGECKTCKEREGKNNQEYGCISFRGTGNQEFDCETEIECQNDSENQGDFAHLRDSAFARRVRLRSEQTVRKRRCPRAYMKLAMLRRRFEPSENQSGDGSDGAPMAMPIRNEFSSGHPQRVPPRHFEIGGASYRDLPTLEILVLILLAIKRWCDRARLQSR
jgi:hypothetical protein